MEPYGQELILDLHKCKCLPMSRKDLEVFLVELCDRIGMVREDLHFWDFEGREDEYEAAPVHLKGTSVVQFILTSTIIIHTLDDTGQIFFNLFSCKDYDSNIDEWVAEYFQGEIKRSTTIERGFR